MQDAHQTNYPSTLLIWPATENDLASADPERMVPIVWAAEHFMLVVTGSWRQGGLTRLFAHAIAQHLEPFDQAGPFCLARRIARQMTGQGIKKILAPDQRLKFRGQVPSQIVRSGANLVKQRYAAVDDSDDVLQIVTDQIIAGARPLKASSFVATNAGAVISLIEAPDGKVTICGLSAA